MENKKNSGGKKTHIDIKILRGISHCAKTLVEGENRHKMFAKIS